LIEVSLTTPIYPLNSDDLSISVKTGKEIGAILAADYQIKSPHDYGCFDNFLPLEILEGGREEALVMG
jgi:hypothetical protein